jgi:hypothetical protein
MAWGPKQAARWEKVRALGKADFVFVRCGLGVGISMWLLLSLWEVCFPKIPFSWSTLFGNMIFLVCGGLLYGVLMWNLLEASYRRYLSSRELKELEQKSAELGVPPPV